MPGTKSIHMRITDKDLEHIKAAAKVSRRSVTSFVTLAAINRANLVLGKDL